MNRHQITVISIAVLLTLVLFFAFGKVPKEANQAKESQKSTASPTTQLLETAEVQAKTKLSKVQLDELKVIEEALSKTKIDSIKVEFYKQIASFWYKANKPEVSGLYAEKIAEITNDQEAWQIAGTTFRIALQSDDEEAVKEVCSQMAIRAFQKAIAIDSSNVNYQMQLAMVYVDKPLTDNPMKGILMLRELNTKYPQNADVNIQLAKLAIRTGQFDKAVERLEKALALSPQTVSINCLLAEAYTGNGNTDKAKVAMQKCKN